MKRLLIVLMMCFSYSFAHNAHAQSDLVGTWNIDANRMLSDLKSGVEFDSLPTQLKQRIQDNIYSRTFVFSKSGSVNITFPSRGVTTSILGSWTYDVPTAELQITAQNRTKRYRIQWEGIDTIHFIPLSVSDKEVLKSLYFKRQE